MRKFFVLFSLLLTLSALPVQAQDDYLYPGTYPNGLTAFVYNGTWTDTYSTVVGMRHLKSTTTQYSGVEFSFFGTGYAIGTRGGVGKGTVIYCRNGGSCTTLDLSTQAANLTIGTTGLSEGFHSVRAFLSVAGGLQFDIDTITIMGDALPKSNVNILTMPTLQSVSVTNFPPVQSVSITNIPSVNITNVPSVSVTNMPTVQHVEVDNFPDSFGSEALTPGFYDDRDARLTFSGDFVRNTADAFSFDTYTSFHTALDYVSFPVIGDKLTIYLSAQPTRVNMRIYIDGVFYNYELGADTPNERFPVQVEFPYGYHLIKVEHRTTSFEVKVDGVLVHEPAVDLWQVGDKTVAFDYRVSTGDFALIIFSFSLLGVGFVFLVLWLLGVRKPRD